MKLNCRPMTMNDSDLLYLWRVDKESVVSSLLTSTPTENEHENWMNGRIWTPCQKVFICEKETPVSTFTVIAKGNCLNFGYMVAPDQRKKGIAMETITLLLEKYGSWDIETIVRDGNIASEKVLSRNGFVKINGQWERSGQ